MSCEKLLDRLIDKNESYQGIASRLRKTQDPYQAMPSGMASVLAGQSRLQAL
jgi:hypothetical protein